MQNQQQRRRRRNLVHVTAGLAPSSPRIRAGKNSGSSAGAIAPGCACANPGFWPKDLSRNSSGA